MTDQQLAQQLVLEVMAQLGITREAPMQRDFEKLSMHLAGANSLAQAAINAAMEHRDRPKDRYGWASYKTFQRFWSDASEGREIKTADDAASIFSAIAVLDRMPGLAVPIEYSDANIPKPAESAWNTYRLLIEHDTFQQENRQLQQQLMRVEATAKDRLAANESLLQQLDEIRAEKTALEQGLGETRSLLDKSRQEARQYAETLQRRQQWLRRSAYKLLAAALLCLVAYVLFAVPVRYVERPFVFKRKLSDSLYTHAVLEIGKPLLWNGRYPVEIRNVHAQDTTGRAPDANVVYKGYMEKVEAFWQISAWNQNNWVLTAHFGAGRDNSKDLFSVPDQEFFGVVHGISGHKYDNTPTPTHVSSYLTYLPAADTVSYPTSEQALRKKAANEPNNNSVLRCNWRKEVLFGL